MARWYAERVVEDKIPTSRWTKLAARRYLDMLAKAESGRASYYFSPEHVVDVCDFVEKIPHVEGYHGYIVLEPWQIFACAAIYGFRRKASGARLVRFASIWVPRKNGKSLLAAALCLYNLTCEGEPGPSVYVSAGTEEQAWKVYGPAKAIVDRDEDFRTQFELKATRDQISCAATNGELKTIASVGEHQDGHNPSMVCAEEMHAQKADVIGVMRSSFGARRNPLFLTISSAGRRAFGVGWEEWKFCQKVLLGQIPGSDHYFALIYTLDEDDLENPLSDIAIRKANPNFCVSVHQDIVQEALVETKKSPSARAEFLRTRLNVWARGGGNLIFPEHWQKCRVDGLKIDDFEPYKGWIGCDLASRNDLAAVGIMFEPVAGLVAVFNRYYLCEDAPIFENEDYGAIYREWIDKGWLTITPGGMIDFNIILADVIELCNRFKIQGIGVDDYQANLFVKALEKHRVPVWVVQKNAKTLTEPTDEFLARVRSATLAHDGNPVTEWCAMNVVGDRDVHGQILPKKASKDSLDKIDGIDALIVANTLRVAPPEGEPGHPYNERGLMGFGGSDEPEQAKQR